MQLNAGSDFHQPSGVTRFGDLVKRPLINLIGTPALLINLLS